MFYPCAGFHSYDIRVDFAKFLKFFCKHLILSVLKNIPPRTYPILFLIKEINKLAGGKLNSLYYLLYNVCFHIS